MKVIGGRRLPMKARKSAPNIEPIPSIDIINPNPPAPSPNVFFASSGIQTLKFIARVETQPIKIIVSSTGRLLSA